MIRERLIQGLAGLLPDDATHKAACNEAYVAGLALCQRGWRAGGVTWQGTRLDEVADALRLPNIAITRVLGFGHQQAAALVDLAGVDATEREEAARLGALFNLGICLFDVICDRHPEKAQRLAARLDPVALERAMAEGDSGVLSTGDLGVDALLCLIADFFGGTRRLEQRRPAGGPVWIDLMRTIRVMYRAELAVVSQLRSTTAPSLSVLRQMWRKSSLPLWTVALVAQLARGEPFARRANRWRCSGRAATRSGSSTISPTSRRTGAPASGAVRSGCWRTPTPRRSPTAPPPPTPSPPSTAPASSTPESAASLRVSIASSAATHPSPAPSAWPFARGSSACPNRCCARP